jgi:exodeoxyribonuclease V beta subunit
MLAALTPFFGLSLEDLPALTADPSSHPLEERLAAWRTWPTRATGPTSSSGVVADSGLAERELLAGVAPGASRTSCTSATSCARGRPATAASLDELVRHLTALVEGLIVPDAEEGNVQRLEGDRDAVQIMSIHKSKGLEADYVFLYGAFSPWRGSKVQAVRA